MSLQYVVYDYWDYGYAEGDAILEFGSASVTAEATVSANGTRIQPNYTFYGYWVDGYCEGDGPRESAQIDALASVIAKGNIVASCQGSVFGNASLNANGIALFSGNASINGNALFTADGTRIKTGFGSIIGQATVSALGNFIYSGVGAINGIASVSAYPNATWSGNASIQASAICSVTGQIIGEEWKDVVPEANVWFNRKLFDPYVEIDYWEDGYTDDRYDYWIKTTTVNDIWTRQ
jgi:hypothetical protein